MELKNYWEIICRRKLLLAQAVAIIVGLAFLPTLFVTPIYEVSAKTLIQLENMQTSLLTDLSALFNVSISKSSFAEERNIVDTFIALVDINPIISKVIQDLHLTDSKGKPIESNDFVVTFLRVPKLLLLQHKGVRIKRVKAAEVLEFIGYSPDREEASRIANAVAHEFSAFLANLYRDKVRATRLEIENQIAATEKKLAQAGEAEASYRVREGLSDPPTQLTTLISERSALETKLRDAERALAEYRTSLNSIQKVLQKQPGFHNKRTILEKNPNIVSFKDQLLTLESKLAGSLAELTPDHPEVKTTKNQIDQINQALRQEITKTFSSETRERNPYLDSLIERQGNAEISIIAQSAITNVLSRQIEGKDRGINNLTEKQREINLLSSNTLVYTNLYKLLLGKLENLTLLEKMNISNAVMVQLAIGSNNAKKDLFFPKRLLILVLALLSAIPFGLFLIFLLESMDDTIQTPGEAKYNLSLPILGIIPKLAEGPLKTSLTRKAPVNLPLWDRFWDLRANIRLSTLNKELKILAVTSMVSGEGKTTVSSHLAATFAQAGQKILLIDLNLRRPHLHLCFDTFELTPGMTNFLLGEADVQDIVRPSAIPGLDLISGGSILPYPAKTLDTPNLAILFDNFKREYDLVILDTASLEDGSDVGFLAPHADHLLLVLASGSVSATTAGNAAEVIKNLNISALGIVFNKYE